MPRAMAKTREKPETGHGIIVREEQDAYCGRIDLCKRGFTVRIGRGVVADRRSQCRGNAASTGCRKCNALRVGREDACDDLVSAP